MDQIDIHQNNQNKFWDKVHLLLPNKQSDPVISLKHKDTGLWIRNEEIPDYVNSFFVNVGSDLSRNNPFDRENYQYIGNEHPGRFELDQVTEEEVLQEISRVKNGKS